MNNSGNANLMEINIERLFLRIEKKNGSVYRQIERLKRLNQ